jgi:hypothetical protein
VDAINEVIERRDMSAYERAGSSVRLHFIYPCNEWVAIMPRIADTAPLNERVNET